MIANIIRSICERKQQHTNIILLPKLEALYIATEVDPHSSL